MVFDYKRRSGQYIGPFAPFGYVKAPADKHHLIVDPDAAGTVKRIYSMFLQGSSKRGRVAPPERTRHIEPRGLPAHEGPARFLRCADCGKALTREL